MAQSLVYNGSTWVGAIARAHDPALGWVEQNGLCNVWDPVAARWVDMNARAQPAPFQGAVGAPTTTGASVTLAAQPTWANTGGRVYLAFVIGNTGKRTTTPPPGWTRVAADSRIEIWSGAGADPHVAQVWAADNPDGSAMRVVQAQYLTPNPGEAVTVHAVTIGQSMTAGQPVTLPDVALTSGWARLISFLGNVTVTPPFPSTATTRYDGTAGTSSCRCSLADEVRTDGPGTVHGGTGMVAATGTAVVAQVVIEAPGTGLGADLPEPRPA